MQGKKYDDFFLGAIKDVYLYEDIEVAAGMFLY